MESISACLARLSSSLCFSGEDAVLFFTSHRGAGRVSMWYLLYREMAALCLLVSFLIVLEDWPKPTWTNLAFWTDAAVCLDAWIQFLLVWWGKKRDLRVA
ncbi:unnamed protein product, partial [Darwinula stevensoni]